MEMRRNLPLALRLATQATRAQPECGAYWNTLGAAAFRAGDPTGAIAALERSIALTDGGNAFDHIFISMANGQLGRREEARRWYVRAAAWIEEHDSHHASLLTLYEEAGCGARFASRAIPGPLRELACSPGYRGASVLRSQMLEDHPLRQPGRVRASHSASRFWR